MDNAVDDGSETLIELDGVDPVFHRRVTALAADMRQNGYNRDDPVREIFALIGDRWTTLILLVLEIGQWRHAELRRVLGRLGAEGKISQRVLTLKLRALERDGIVLRYTTAGVPAKVSYELSPLGMELTIEVKRMIGWVHVNRSAIDTARAEYLNEKSYYRDVLARE
jgi:DNA-binding HxlR family transcriptional regulator